MSANLGNSTVATGLEKVNFHSSPRKDDTKECSNYHTAAKSLQLCLTLYNSIDFSLPGSSVHGILQARIQKWVSISFSRGSS